MRVEIESEIRRFFRGEGFQEVRTPLLVPSPGMEIHIHPFQLDHSKPLFLPTSPEFAMKKLLVGGMKKIFQINSSFRNEPLSQTHLPEFTLLEWYDVAGYEAVWNQAEKLIQTVARKIHGKLQFKYLNQTIDLSSPWPKYRVQELFQKNIHLNLTSNTSIEELVQCCQKFKISASNSESWDDLYFKLWLNIIEPEIQKNRPCFVYDYPESQAALAKTKKDKNGNLWARRFEVYVGGLELANAFDELLDPKVQLGRFIKDQALRKNLYGKKFPVSQIDHSFISALKEGLPDCGGIALGVDRLLMLLANIKDIRETVCLPEYEFKNQD